MIIELTIMLSTYGGLRLFKKKQFNKEKRCQQQKLIAINKNIDNVASKSIKKERDVAYLALGTSIIQPLFFPSLSLLNPILLTGSGYSYLKNAEQSLAKKKINNDVLGLSWLLFAGLSGQYFAAAVGNIVYHIGTDLIDKTRDKSAQAMVSIFDSHNKKVWLLQENTEIETPLEQVLKGDILVVHSGDMIAVDGIIIQGKASIDEHVLTGEFQAVDKQENDSVFASTVLNSGKLLIEVTEAGNNTAVAKIENLLNKTTDSKIALQLKGEQWADDAAPYLLGAAGLTAMTVGFIPATIILMANFGYHLRMVMPLGTLRYLSKATQSGILIKDGRSLEQLNTIDTILFDKTGTLTEEQPVVGEIITWHGHDKQNILKLAALAEAKLKHPIAKAILKAYGDNPLYLDEIEEAHYEIGFGVKIKWKQQTIRVGSVRFMSSEGYLSLNEHKQTQLAPIYQQGHSIIMVSIDDDIVGAIEIKPTLRPEVSQLIQKLKQHNIKHFMIISGDHQKPTQQLAKKLGISEYYAEVLPEDKANIVKQQQQQGRKVCFIGDGINDTIAMKQADVSISLQGASSIAIDTANIIFMNGRLNHLPYLFKLAHRTHHTTKMSATTVVACSGLILIGSISFNIGLLMAVLIRQGFIGANVWYIIKSSQ